MSATNQGPTATIDSAMSVRVGGGGTFIWVIHTMGVLSIKMRKKYEEKKTTMVSLRQISETAAFLM